MSAKAHSPEGGSQRPKSGGRGDRSQGRLLGTPRRQGGRGFPLNRRDEKRGAPRGQPDAHLQSNKPELVWVRSLQGLSAEDRNQAGGANLAGGQEMREGWREGGREDGARDTGRFLGALASPGREACGRQARPSTPPLGEAGEAETVPAPSFNIQTTSDRS